MNSLYLCCFGDVNLNFFADAESFVLKSQYVESKLNCPGRISLAFSTQQNNKNGHEGIDVHKGQSAPNAYSTELLLALKLSSVNNTELSTASKKKRTGSFNFSLKSEIKDRNLKKFLQREWSFIGTDERTPEELESIGKISVPYQKESNIYFTCNP